MCWKHECSVCLPIAADHGSLLNLSSDTLPNTLPHCQVGWRKVSQLKHRMRNNCCKFFYMISLVCLMNLNPSNSASVWRCRLSIKWLKPSRQVGSHVRGSPLSSKVNPLKTLSFCLLCFLFLFLEARPCLHFLSINVFQPVFRQRIKVLLHDSLLISKLEDLMDLMVSYQKQTW